MMREMSSEIVLRRTPQLASVLLAWLMWSADTTAATISECQELLRTGKYVECLDAATDAVERRSYGEEWPMLKATTEMRLGRYLQAQETIAAGIVRYSWSIRLRMLSHENCRLLGELQQASDMIDEINRLALRDSCGCRVG